MKKLLTPIIIYICFIIIYIGISEFNNNDYLFLPIWDVEHYLSISERGYEVFPCTPGVNGPAGAICGNSGWFPMWPIVVSVIRPILSGSSQYTFIGLSFLFTLLFFALFFRFIEKNYGFKPALISLLAVAMNPAGFYWLTGFPYALFAFLFILYLILLYGKNSIWRGIGLFLIAIAISITYPTGFLILIVPLVREIFRNKGEQIKIESFKYWRKIILYSLPFILGPLLLATYFYFKFDDFFLQLHFQAKYARTWAFPIWIMLKSIFTESILSPENISIIWFGLVFILFYPYRLFKELWILALVLYLFSLTTGTTMSIFRHYLIIIPAYMLIGVSSKPIWLKLAFIVVGFVSALAVLFPLFMLYRLM
jgi:hypothetical protein